HGRPHPPPPSPQRPTGQPISLPTPPRGCRSATSLSRTPRCRPSVPQPFPACSDLAPPVQASVGRPAQPDRPRPTRPHPPQTPELTRQPFRRRPARRLAAFWAVAAGPVRLRSVGPGEVGSAVGCPGLAAVERDRLLPPGRCRGDV